MTVPSRAVAVVAVALVLAVGAGCLALDDPDAGAEPTGDATGPDAAPDGAGDDSGGSDGGAGHDARAASVDGGAPSEGELPPNLHRLGYSARTDRLSVAGDVMLAVHAGVYVSDVDRDGRRDVLAIGGDRPRLLVNTGDGFEEGRGFDAPGTGGALFLDHDGDGWDDLLLLRSGGNASVFYENVEGRFERRTVGLERVFEAPRGAVAGDVDGDGCLDVAVYQAGDWTERRPEGYGSLSVGEDNGGRNLLFMGSCGAFELRRGALPPLRRWSLAASMVDFTGDGAVDLHVANDFNRDVLYVNDGEGGFAAREIAETNRNGMSSEVGDVDGDGRPDVFVSNIYYEGRAAELLTQRVGDRIAGNNLLVNDGDGGFVDRAAAYGVRRGGWGWAAVLADFDLDGDDDLFQATTDDHGSGVPNLYWDRRANDSYVNASRPGLSAYVNTLGAATLDHDGDGALDVALTAVEGRSDVGSYVVYDNPATGHWLALDVEGNGSTTAIGATVTVRAGGERYTRWVTSGSDYLSQDSRRIHVGLGDAETVDAVTVDWPYHGTTTIRDLAADAAYRVRPDGASRAG